MHSTAEHKKKAATATAAMAVPTESTHATSSIADSDSEDSGEDSEDSAYNAFVAFTTDLEVGDDVPPERPLPQVREATHVEESQVTPVSALQGHIWPFQHWIDGELYYASSNAPSATFYRAAVMPIPRNEVSTSTPGRQRRRCTWRKPCKHSVKDVCRQRK